MLLFSSSCVHLQYDVLKSIFGSSVFKDILPFVLKAAKMLVFIACLFFEAFTLLSSVRSQDSYRNECYSFVMACCDGFQLTAQTEFETRNIDEVRNKKHLINSVVKFGGL